MALSRLFASVAGAAIFFTGYLTSVQAQVDSNPRPSLQEAQSFGSIDGNGGGRPSDGILRVTLEGENLSTGLSAFAVRNLIDFGQRIQGSKRPDLKTLQIKNISDQPVRVFRMRTSKPFSHKIQSSLRSLQSQLQSSGFVLEPGESQNVDLFYGEQELGEDKGGFRFYYQSKKDQKRRFRSFRATLVGQVMTPPVMVVFDGKQILESGDKIDAGTVRAPKIKQHELVIENQGTGADLVIENVHCENEDEFGIAENLPIRIPAGEKAKFTIEFKPRTQGPKSDLMTVDINYVGQKNFVTALRMFVMAPVLTILEDDQEVELPHNEDTASDFSPLGGNVYQEGDVTRTYFLRNDGDAPLTVFGIENIQIDSFNKVYVLNNPAAPVTLQPQELYEFELSAQDDSWWLQCGYIEVESDDLNPAYLPGSQPGRKKKRFNVAGAVGKNADLICSSDSLHYVENGFSCVGQENGTICGESNGKSMFCNTDQCVLLGDTNLDGDVNRDDISAFIEDVFGDRLLAQADMLCAGTPTSATMNIRAFADAVALSENDQAYNSRVREHCNIPAEVLASRGTALVFPPKAIESIAPGEYDYVAQERVCLDELGVFSLTDGTYLADNYDATEDSYVLQGRYTNAIEVYGAPIFPRVDGGVENNFEVPFMDPTLEPTEALGQASAINAYYHVTNFRNRFMDEAFIRELNLDPDKELNLLYAQGRTTGYDGIPYIPRIAGIDTRENVGFGGTSIDVSENAVFFDFRTLRFGGLEGTFPLASTLDGGFVAGEYAGLMAFWVPQVNEPFPSEAGCDEGTTFVTACLNDAMEYFSAALYEDKNEIEKTFRFTSREWDELPCDGSPFEPECDRGIVVDHIMQYEKGNLSADQVYPFDTQIPGAMAANNGPDDDRGAIFWAGVFYDVAHEAGLGWRKANLLFWKSISYITTMDGLDPEGFADMIVQASRELWPNGPGVGLYDDVIEQTLASRGIPVMGAETIAENLPAPIGDASTVDIFVQNVGFGTLHPDKQIDIPGTYLYGGVRIFQNGYTNNDPMDYEYLALTSYKNSKYGPCDRWMLTDGSFYGLADPDPGEYRGDGTYLATLRERNLGNRTLFVPGNRVVYMHYRKHCDDETQAPYYLDTHPFGFKIVNEIKNGFSYTVQRLSESGESVRYQLTIDDPSLTIAGGPRTGPATYDWSFSNPLGLNVNASGQVVEIEAPKNEPLSISVTRTRGTFIDTLDRTDRANDLDRDNGRAFVTACIDGSGATIPECQ